MSAKQTEEAIMKEDQETLNPGGKQHGAAIASVSASKSAANKETAKTEARKRPRLDKRASAAAGHRK